MPPNSQAEPARPTASSCGGIVNTSRFCSSLYGVTLDMSSLVRNQQAPAAGLSAMGAL